MIKGKSVFNKIIRTFNEIRKRRGSIRRFNLYYMTRKEDTRSNSAKVIDYILSRSLLFFFTFFLMIIWRGGIIVPIIITVTFMVLFNAATIKVRGKKLMIMKEEKRRSIAYSRVYQDIINKTSLELQLYFEKLLKKSNFVDIKNIYTSSNHLLYEGLYHEEKMLISFYAYKGENYVELKELKEFHGYMKDMNLRKGIVITTTDLTKDASNYANGMKYDKVYVLNKELVLRLLEYNNMLLSEEEIDEIIENRISKREDIWWKYKGEILSKKKTKSYFVLSIFLLVFSSYSPFPKYYFIIGLLSITFAIITLLNRNLFSQNKDTSQEDYLYQLLNQPTDQI